jgi:hypothetical protein
LTARQLARLCEEVESVAHKRAPRGRGDDMTSKPWLASYPEGVPADIDTSAYP